MRLEDTFYHSCLRIAAATVACVLVFQSGVLISSTAQWTAYTRSYVANSIGVGASVKPNELNVITAHLTQREQELTAREAALAQREIAVGVGGVSSSQTTDWSTYILSAFLFILLLLIILNYALDYSRARAEVTSRYVPRSITAR